MKVPSFILEKTTIQTEKMWQFYLSLSLWAVVYTTLNVSIVIFLKQQFGSYFLAGLALAIGNTCSLFFDLPFNYLQKILAARTLFLTSILTVFSAVLIFLFLLIFIESAILKIIFLFLATIIFSVSYDLYNITTNSYILAESMPSQYGQNLAYKQVAQGFGLIGGLIISAILIFMANLVEVAGGDLVPFLAATQVIMLFLLSLLLALFLFAYTVFDQEKVQFDFKHTLEEFPSNLSAGFRSGAIKAIDLMENNLEKIKQNLQPNQVYLVNTKKKKTLIWQEIFSEMKINWQSLVNIFTSEQKNYALLWGTVVMTIFSFWDTFLASFQPAFMNEIMQAQKGTFWEILPGNIFYLFLLLPVFVFMTPIAKWGDKYGKDYFVLGGLILTSVSCLLLGIISLKFFIIVIISGFGISFGYTAGIACVRASFAEKFNAYIAIFKGQNTIDSNASVGPMMMVDNLGNIIGPLLGGAIISVMDFQSFFVLFGLFTGTISVLSFVYFKKITTPPYVFPDNGN